MTWRAVAAVGVVTLIGCDRTTASLVAGAEPPTRSPWTALAPMPEARAQMGVAVLDGIVYVAGGVAPTRNGWAAHAEIFAYDPTPDEWRTVGALLHPVSGPGMAALGDRLYVVGGSNDYAELQIIDPATGRVEAGPRLPAPMTRATLTVLDGKLHAIGVVESAGGDPFCDFGTIAHVVFDPSTGAWSTRADPPWVACTFSGAVTVGGVIHFVGGSGRGEVAVYQPETDSWATYPAPHNLNNAATVAFDDKLFLIGGEGYDDCGNPGPLAGVNRFDPATESWTEIGPMLTPRAGAGAAVVGSFIYIIGGWSLEPTSDLGSGNQRFAVE